MSNKPRRTEKSLSASSSTHLLGSWDGFYKEGFSSEGRAWEETEGGDQAESEGHRLRVNGAHCRLSLKIRLG